VEEEVGFRRRNRKGGISAPGVHELVKEKARKRRLARVHIQKRERIFQSADCVFPAKELRVQGEIVLEKKEDSEREN